MAKLPVLILLIWISLQYLSPLMKLYFNGNLDSYSNNLNIIIIMVSIFSTLPIVEFIIFKNKKSFAALTFTYNQLIWDMNRLVVGFVIIDFFQKEVMTIVKNQTTLPVLFMGLLLMGMLGGEIWESLYKVPQNAIRYFNRLRNNKINQI